MENILNREKVSHIDSLDLKYDLETSVSEEERIEDDSFKDIAIDEDIVIKEEPHSQHFSDDNLEDTDIKQGNMLDLSSEIILPQASQTHLYPLKPRKESKSRKELEEEEREKMQ